MRTWARLGKWRAATYTCRICQSLGKKRYPLGSDYEAGSTAESGAVVSEHLFVDKRKMVR
jgi:hypothetical protein